MLQIFQNRGLTSQTTFHWVEGGGGGGRLVLISFSLWKHHFSTHPPKSKFPPKPFKKRPCLKAEVFKTTSVRSYKAAVEKAPSSPLPKEPWAGFPSTAPENTPGPSKPECCQTGIAGPTSWEEGCRDDTETNFFCSSLRHGPHRCWEER